MFKKVLFLSLAFLVIAGKDALAARPLATDDASTVDKGHFEYEFGFETAKDTDKEYGFSNCLKYGLWDRLDIGCEVPFAYIEADDEGGLSDVSLSLKYNFLREKAVDLSGRFDFKADTADDDKGLGSGDEDYAWTLIASKEFSMVVLHLNFGYTFVGAEDDVFGYSIALEKPVSEECNVVCEIVTETDFSGDFDDHPCEATLGFNYAIFDNATVDFAVAVPFSKASPDYKLMAGVTVGF